MYKYTYIRTLVFLSNSKVLLVSFKEFRPFLIGFKVELLCLVLLELLSRKNACAKPYFDMLWYNVKR